LPNTQLPPTRSDASKTVQSIPYSCSPFAAVIPDEPAPMMAVRGSVFDTRAPPKVKVDAPVTLVRGSTYVNVQE
jgi:hypothetical protein